MAFASTQDVATRLGRTLSEPQEAMAELLLDVTTGLIAHEVDRDEDWADTLDPVPQVLRLVCFEVVVRAMSNPDGLKALQERLGQYQHSTQYRDAVAGGGLLLTDTECRLVRRAVWGKLSASPRVGSLVDDLYGS